MTLRKHSRRHYASRILREVWSHPANAGSRGRAVARAVGWQVRKRVVRRPVDVAFAGLVLRCHPDSGSAANVHYFTERYDWHEMGFVRSYLRPGDRVLDVGANIGTYTLLAASLVGPEGGVVALEPLPRAAEHLRENVALNHLRQVEVHEVAADVAAGTLPFLDFDVSSVADHDTDRRGRTAFDVRAARLDDLVEGGLALAKLDVEGLELRALQGATGLLARQDPPVWLVETMDWQLAKHGASLAALLAFFDDHGYGPTWYDADRGVLDDEGWRGRDNALFVARAARHEVEARLVPPR